MSTTTNAGPATSTSASSSRQSVRLSLPRKIITRGLIPLGLAVGLILALWPESKGDNLSPEPTWMLIFYNEKGEVRHESRATMILGDPEISITYKGGRGGIGRLHGKKIGARSYRGEGNERGWAGGRFTLELNEYKDSGSGHWSTPDSVNTSFRTGGKIQIIRQ